MNKQCDNVVKEKLQSNDKKIYEDKNICLESDECVEVCELDSLVDEQFKPLVDMIKSDEPVLAVVAPAIAGQFGENVTLAQMRTAFKKIGFKDMIEVAFFADMLTLKEAIEFGEATKNGEDIVMTSCCCPMWFGMVKKSYDKITKNANPTVSPMIAAGRVLKKIDPNRKIVFIGPCIAKKAEAKSEGLKGVIDLVLNFQEIKSVFEALNIKPEELKESYTCDYASKQGRSYARAGGVSLSIASAVKSMFPDEYPKLKIAKGNGVKECRELLSKALSGELDANFIEGMGCSGGCVGGPKAILKANEGKEMVDKTADKANIDVSVNNECMKKILKQIGINGIEDFKDKEKTKIFEREIL